MKQVEALGLMDQVCAMFKGTRQEHASLMEALKTIKELLPKVTKEDDKVEKQGSTN